MSIQNVDEIVEATKRFSQEDWERVADRIGCWSDHDFLRVPLRMLYQERLDRIAADEGHLERPE